MKKLQNWKEKLAPIIDSSPYSLEEHAKTLESLGFKRLRNEVTSYCSYGIVFINKKARLVIKESYFVGDKPKRAIPTIFVTEKNNGIVIQPLAKTLSKKEKEKYDEGSLRDGGNDQRCDNVAYYRNRLVVIDW